MPPLKPTVHTWGNDSKRNPVAKMTSRIISEARQPASWMRTDTGKGLLDQSKKQAQAHLIVAIFTVGKSRTYWLKEVF